MATIVLPSISREQYLQQERRAATRSEYHKGRVIAMTGASRTHNRIVTNLTSSLDHQLKSRPCNNYSNDMRVAVQGGERYLYPDVVVTCGRELFEDAENDILLNPLVIIEVLSPSTEVYDRGEKFLAYQTIPSLREYALVSQSPRRMEIYRRQPDDTWVYQTIPPSPPPLILQSIDCTLTLDDVYSKVEEESSREPPLSGAGNAQT